MHIIRTATVHDPDVSALPPEFRKVLTGQDIEAIRTGPAYFSKLAHKDAPKWLADLLGHCAKSRYTLQFHSSGEVPYRPYFRFNWQGEPAISLPRSAKLRRDMPPFLRRLYKLIGAFRENEFNYAGGLHPGDTLVPVSKTGI